MRKTSNASKYIAISIIEDNYYARKGWISVLDTIPDFIILGSYSACEEALDAQEIGNSDVILMDIGLPRMSGIECVNNLLKQYSKISVIMVTVHDDDQHVFEAICAGAVGYLLKKAKPEELIQAIREAYAGGSPMTPTIARKVISSFHTVSKTENDMSLNDRERSVLEQLSKGKSYKDIGNKLNLSIDGVRYHIRGIYEKLQVHSRSEAIAKGLKNRIIRPPH